MKAWIFLSIAILSEVIATSFLKESNGFSRLRPSVIVIAGYVTAFYFLSLVLKTIPVGVVYAGQSHEEIDPKGLTSAGPASFLDLFSCRGTRDG